MGKPKVFLVSLCKQGVLGGLMYVKEQALWYCTNKLTVPPEIRRLGLPYEDMAQVKKAPGHTLCILMKGGEQYRFLVFARARLLRELQSRMGELSGKASP